MSVYVPPSSSGGNSCSGSCDTLYIQQYSYLGNYLNAHMLSVPSHRYAYLMWFVIAGVVLISAGIHHLGVGDKTWIGAAWTKSAPKSRIIKFGKKPDPSALISRTRSNEPSRQAGGEAHSYPPKGAAQLAPQHAPPPRQRYVITLPSIGRLFLAFWLLAVPVILTLVGADYIRPTAGMFDLSASWPNASDARYGFYGKRDALVKRIDWGLGSFSPVSTSPATYSIPYHTWWTSGGRTGLMTNALTPFVTLLALKQVPWALLSTKALGGHAFERLSFLHKWGGRLIWLFAIAHTVTWSVQLSKDQQFGTSLWGFVFIWPKFRWAFVSMGFLTLLVLLSLGPIRRNYYEFFYIGHIVCAIGFMAAAAAHHPPLAGWMIAALAWWGAERLTRAIKVAYVNGIGFAGRKPEQVLVSSGAPQPAKEQHQFHAAMPSMHSMQPPRRHQQESIGGHTSSSATLYDGSPALKPMHHQGGRYNGNGKPSFLDTDPRERQPAPYTNDEEWELDENGDKVRRRPSQRYGPVSDLLKEYASAGARGSAMSGIEEDVPLAGSSRSGSVTPHDDPDRWEAGQDLGSANHEDAWRGRAYDNRSSQSHTLDGMGPLSSADHYSSMPQPQPQAQPQQQPYQHQQLASRPMTARSRDWSPSGGSVERDPRPALPADVAALIKPGYAFCQVLPGKTLRLTLRTPNRMSWQPGQWVYLNVPAVKGWQSHPFTIASAYDAAMPIVSTNGDRDLEKGLKKERRKRGEERTMVLLLRARKGFTLDLWEYVRRHRHSQVVAAEEQGLNGSIANTTGVHLRAIVDGAFGSTKRVRWGIHSSIVIVCGGSGISFGMSLLEHLCACLTQRNVYGASKRGGKDFEVQRVRFVWILREYSHLQWVSSALRRCIEMVPPEQLQVDLYVTHINNQVALGARMAGHGARPTLASRPSSFMGMNTAPASRPTTAEEWQTTDPGQGWQTSGGDVVAPASGPQRLMEGGEADDLDIGFNDLTEFDGEDQAGLPSAAEQAINSRIQQEGKLRRANTRKATLKRSKKQAGEKQGQPQQGTQEDAMRVAAQRAMFDGQIQATIPTSDRSYEPSPHRPPMSRPGTANALGVPGSSAGLSGASTPLSWEAENARPDQHWRQPSYAGSVFAQSSLNHSSANLISSSHDPSSYSNEHGAPAGPDRSEYAGLDDPIDLDAEEDLDLRLIAELAQPGHPRLDRLIANEVQRASGRVMVASCGPESLSAILRRIVAKHIDPSMARGSKTGKGIVNLATESFEWGGS
ncbi:hypothetical protein BDZ90DRAFT_251857 [Jaminaea rosea]|uniref:ferric-chelate reductase (NADPH) n=1 Tax=Jaminaea rosea TaxID=1569628 RepID=A0A316USB8_9BASI|nr:hypothetical protein BDZ90DRAFT_251857 [Jaminaea rosea]PWN28177.1 hypothetical protein BDZ90DRAFT_251857 [Jaminaea rosea]